MRCSTCMQSILTSQHGFGSQDAFRAERWQAQANALQREACETDGILAGKKSCFIVTLENTSSAGPFVIHGVRTAEEVRQAVYDYNKKLPNETIRLDLYSARMGTINRQKLEGPLPSDLQEIYVRLSLQKHPPIPATAKFEQVKHQGACTSPTIQHAAQEEY
jgi:hypothetical protein